MEIMCTLTRQQALDRELVCELCRAGMQAVRINTAHLDGVVELDQMAHALKGADPSLRILIDTKGPEMRTSGVDSPIRLVEGATIAIEGTPNSSLPTPDSSLLTIYVNYPDIHLWATPGRAVLIDDATIQLTVKAVEGCRIIATVTRGGKLGAHKGLTISDVDVPLPAVSERDRMFIAHAAASPLIDLVAHSFVRSADDVRAVIAAMAPHRKPLIAKIENQQGLDNLPDIATQADGLLIARGDLGASIGKDRLPAAQQQIADAAVRARKPAILATGILPSLADIPTPSEADGPTPSEADGPTPSEDYGPTPSEADIAGIRLAATQSISTMLLTNETASSPRPASAVSALLSAWPSQV